MLETIILVCALCLDAFVASIAYGANKIKIPFLSSSIISLVSSGMLGISLFLGCVLKNLIPYSTTKIISFVILFLLGFVRLFESLLKNYIQKNSNRRKVRWELFDFQFVLDIYADETKADFDKSKYLNSKEALYLSLALSLDSLAAGLGSGLGDVHYLEIIIFSLTFNFIAVILGTFLGTKIADALKINLSWLSGLMLILLAFLRFA